MNNELIKIETNENKNEVTITSLEIAELTGKQHFIIIRDIEEQLSNLGQYKFVLSNYLDTYTTKQNKQVKMYRLPRREALIVVSGYNVKLRAKIIDRLEELEKQLKNNYRLPQSYKEALIELAQQVEQVERLENENKQQALTIKEQEPKVAFANAYTSSDNCMLIRDFAKYLTQNHIEIGEKRLFRWLRLNDYLCQNNMPTQKAMSLKLFNVSAGTYTTSKGETINTHTTKLTPKGQVYFLKKFKEIPTVN